MKREVGKGEAPAVDRPQGGVFVEPAGAQATPTEVAKPMVVGTASLHIGARIGRYTALRAIGGGGMGMVWEAFDDELNRKIAIKVITNLSEERAELETMGSRLSPSIAAAAHARLIAEAQAQARLSHPNVVPVYDVGQSPYGVFMAMELVVGDTIKGWARKQQRSWREVARVFLQAGAGLVAAHELGLVHRDVKPDNLLIGQDGRVLVADFGLATAHRVKRKAGGLQHEGLSRDNLTVIDEVAGTPSYMSPEQHRGEAPSKAADQYSFCVSFFEVLYGVRPFRGTSSADFIVAIEAGDVAKIPVNRRAPAWLHKILIRGLSAQPELRFASLAELLAEVQAGLERTVWPMLLTIAGTMGIAAGLIVWQHQRNLRDELCEAQASRIDQVWNDDVWHRLDHEVRKLPTGQGIEIRSALEKVIGERVEAWHALQAQVCHSRQEAPKWSALVDECLQANLAQDLAFVSLISGEGENRWRRFSTLMRQLESPDKCIHGDPPTDLRDRPRDPAKLGPYLDVAREVRGILLETKTGSLQTVNETLLAGLEDRALSATAFGALAQLTLLRSEREASALRSRTAWQFSDRGIVLLDLIHDDANATNLLSRELYSRGYTLGVDPNIDELIGHARAHALRSDDPEYALADLCVQVTPYLGTTGKIDQANDCLRRAIVVLARATGENSNPTTTARDYLATGLTQNGYDAEAEAILAEIVRERSNEIGGENIGLCYTLTNLATSLQERGELRLARDHLEHAYRLAESQPDNLELRGYVGIHYLRQLLVFGHLAHAQQIAVQLSELLARAGVVPMRGLALQVDTLWLRNDLMLGKRAEGCAKLQRTVPTALEVKMGGFYGAGLHMIVLTQLEYAAYVCGEEKLLAELQAHRLALGPQRISRSALDGSLVAESLELAKARGAGDVATVQQNFAKMGALKPIDQSIDNRSRLMAVRREYTQWLLDRGETAQARTIIERDAPVWSFGVGDDLRSTWRDQVAYARANLLSGDPQAALAQLRGLPEGIAEGDRAAAPMAELYATRVAALVAVGASSEEIDVQRGLAQEALQRLAEPRPSLAKLIQVNDRDLGIASHRKP